MSNTLSAFAALVLASGSAAAQCKVSGSSNEGKLLAFYTVPIVFSPTTAPEQLLAGAVRLGLDGEYIPKPSAEIQKTGKCFTEKSEQTSISPVFGRPRVTVGLPGGIALEASYLPPVKISDAKPNLASMALSRTQHLGIASIIGGVDLMLRAHATFGNVKGPITCPKSALQQTSSTAPCYGTTPSNDTFHPNVYGVELIGAVRPPRGALAYYGGVGINRIDPRFQVGFTDGTGHVDNTKVQLDSPLYRAAFIAGITAKPESRFDVGLQLYTVPVDATTVRFQGGISFR